ncbi:hypothetical protein C8R43DRAFT_1061882 [Mycena crocata]|nr:hypothetical protein C8R43DRAFT_1061882 [Mycena crocata]
MVKLDTLPPELLFNLPAYLHNIEDLLSLSLTCRTLYRTCANPEPKLVLQLAEKSGRTFFRPHPHFLLGATARQLADWAVKDDDHRHLLEVAIQGGVDKLLGLALEVATLTMDDIRRLHKYKCDVLNVLNRRLDLSAGPGSGNPMTVCNDPETTLLSWIIYGELFHHSLELAYLPLPEHKPLSSVIRYKWFVYCMPDVNSFRYMEFGDVPDFFKKYRQDDDDRFQQLSMSEAFRQMLAPSMWREELVASPSFLSTHPDLRDSFISCVMHMGMRSLEVLVPGGPERLKEDLARISRGVNANNSGGSETAASDLLKFVGDPWLWTPYPTLQSDVAFTLWSNWEDEDTDPEPLMEAIRAGIPRRSHS